MPACTRVAASAERVVLGELLARRNVEATADPFELTGKSRRRRLVATLRLFPRRPSAIEYPSDFTVRRVAASGRIRWKSALVTIGRALEGESIGIELEDGMHQVFFGDVRLASWTTNAPSWGWFDRR